MKMQVWMPKFMTDHAKTFVSYTPDQLWKELVIAEIAYQEETKNIIMGERMRNRAQQRTQAQKTRDHNRLQNEITTINALRSLGTRSSYQKSND